MEWTGLNDLREMFLSFYQSKGHYRMDSFPLIPQDDKSLLLINSGMAPLKKYFLGLKKVPGNRATTCQKCIRTPDIERVGKTARHGTFFEMLGNFSFADYFKREAINWAWEFMTQVVKLPADKLYISVFEDDDEAYDIWTKEIDVAPEHMVRFGREDNFWEIGSGPCGPCSEIYFDRGEKYGCGKPTCAVGCDCDRYVEVWNLVFTQFISDGNGHYEKMEHGNIDTGMGLERLACVVQGVDNLFEVDTVQNIMRHIERIANVKYKQHDEATDVSLRVITDHVRSTVFMIGDGVGPANEGRGYVLRRLLRRAARHGRLLGIKKPFLYEVCDTVIDENKNAYPELDEHREYIRSVIKAEEERFAKTIDSGSELLGELLEQIKNDGGDTLSGEDAFRLNDTFGFPLDLTREIAAERGIAVDEQGYNELMKVQRERARADAKSRDFSWESDLFRGIGAKATEFVGYETLACDAKLLAIAAANELTDAASEGDEVRLVLDKTPFYAESGGQVGDRGTITTADGAVVGVSDCRKSPEGYYVHSGTVKNGMLRTGKVTAQVDVEIRSATMRNHTAAHLLQAALRRVLGEHVHQAGSYVDEHRVRFDFTHFEAVSAAELSQVERIVNEEIMAAVPMHTDVMPIEQAKKEGAMALFGEKYGDTVRVVTVPDFSKEFCGGTHVDNTGKLGLFRIISESSVAAGVRRIEGTTGFGVLALSDERQQLLEQTAAALKISAVSELPRRAESVAAELHEREREVEKLNSRLAMSQLDDIIKSAVKTDGVTVYSANLHAVDVDTLRTLCDTLRERDSGAVAVLAAVNGEKGTFAACCGEKAVESGIFAGSVAKAAAAVTGGSGGGKKEFAQAGAKDITKIDAALKQLPQIISQMKRG